MYLFFFFNEDFSLSFPLHLSLSYTHTHTHTHTPFVVLNTKERNEDAKMENSGDFPGCPVVKTPPFQCKGIGLILDWGTKISHASGHGQINQ